MSRKSSFKEQLERPAKARAVARDPSAFPLEVRIEPGESFRSPVSLAMLLRDLGLGLEGGHAAVTEMAAKRTVTVTVFTVDPDGVIRRLNEMGLKARVAQTVASP